VKVLPPLLYLGFLWAGCGSQPTAGPSPASDAGSCLTDPIGQSPPLEDCSHVLPAATDCPSAVPSYDGDIAPIIASRCTLCHSPSGIANTVLFDTYDQAYSWYKVMYTQIYSCLMPPSCAGALPDEERQALLKWFVCKAPRSPSQSKDAGAGDANAAEGGGSDANAGEAADDAAREAADDAEAAGEAADAEGGS